MGPDATSLAPMPQCEEYLVHFCQCDTESGTAQIAEVAAGYDQSHRCTE